MSMQSYYRNMDDDKMRDEFSDLVAKWQRCYRDRNGWTPHEALTALWIEADRRGWNLPDCDACGGPGGGRGRW